MIMYSSIILSDSSIGCVPRGNMNQLQKVVEGCLKILMNSTIHYYLL